MNEPRHSRLNRLLLVVGLGLLAVGFGLVVSRLGNYIIAAGHQIHSTDIVSDYLYALAWGLLLSILVATALPANMQERRALVLLWFVKLAVTLIVMLPYEKNYCADACAYHRAGLLLHDLWPAMTAFGGAPGFGNGTANMQVFTEWHAVLISQSYHVMKVTWSLLGFIAIYLIYRAATLYLGKRDVRVLYLLGLFPGILFWSSIFGKDPLTLLGIAAYTLGVVGWYREHRPRWLVLLLAGLIFAASMRVWLGAIFMLPVVLLMLRDASLTRRILIGGIAVMAFAVAFSMSLDKFHIESADDAVSTTGGIAQSWAHGGSANKIAGGLHSFGDILMFMPLGMFSALFRPLPGEVGSAFGLLASVENVILLWLLGVIIVRSRWRRITKDPLLLWATLLVLTWSSIYGIASYQNLGSAVRFKLQIEPILLLLLIRLAQRNPDPVPTGDWRPRRKQVIYQHPYEEAQQG